MTMTYFVAKFITRIITF